MEDQRLKEYNNIVLDVMLEPIAKDDAKKCYSS